MTSIIHDTTDKITNSLSKEKCVNGEICILDGKEFYRIRNVDRISPFLMSITSSDNHWMFISSNGGLTAGRVNEAGSLFPYETEDKLHYGHTHTGPVTVIRATGPDGTSKIWKPFSNSFHNDQIFRNLYKNAIGNQVVFEEINNELSLTFRYSWQPSNSFGFVRTATVENHGTEHAEIEILDGLRNIMPSGLELSTQQTMSNLADAYKQTEFDPNTGLAIYALASLLMDRPQPGESLKASIVWSTGLSNYSLDLSEEAIPRFINREKPEYHHLLTGIKGAYLINTTLTLAPGSKKSWNVIADIGQDQSDIVALRKLLKTDDNVADRITSNIEDSARQLIQHIASADGFQKTACQVCDYHHSANVLFNIMRGGVFQENYSIDISDLRNFIKIRNQSIYKNYQHVLEEFPTELHYLDLLQKVEQVAEPNLIRLCYEYVPIMFSRRHGDPSRPWNRFDIHIKDNAGNRILNYQGNWRDIFQNWEALCFSFPEFIESIIAKFVNASTIDGFNPYRITRNGIDWEKLDPDNTWAFIGYWGDHQIVYLLKLLQASQQFHPNHLTDLLNKPIFSYANIPYRIKNYDQLIVDSKHTINFDFELDSHIESLIPRLGTDARLLMSNDHQVYHVTLLEKLLVPFLSKLSNMIPDGGIWLNTQRPEWNDANNALVGNGISMVTLYYLHRYTQFLVGILSDIESPSFSISEEIIQWFKTILKILHDHRHLLNKPAMDDAGRRQVMDALGSAFSDYRLKVYKSGFSGVSSLLKKDILQLLEISAEYFDHAIEANRRENGLYHAYNLLDIDSSSDSASITPLYEMLEGQVAALSSGELTRENALSNLKTLFESGMYREDQKSFMLYPLKVLPKFLDKNIISSELLATSPLLIRLMTDCNNEIILKDDDGNYRFNSSFRNANDLKAALEVLTDPELKEITIEESQHVLDVYEKIFNHRAFTGRSGGMYAYEGIGSIYWHMVAKLLLAVQEYCVQPDSKVHTSNHFDFYEYYYKIRDGLGFNKTPQEYGAFPFDPYSHTPAHSGAKQPGMTGQVKEEILTRFGELGVIPDRGKLSFIPKLLRKKEFLRDTQNWAYYDINGLELKLELKSGCLAFTYCQVPIVYELVSDNYQISIFFEHKTVKINGNQLPFEISHDIYSRSGNIRLIQVHIPESTLFY